MPNMSIVNTQRFSLFRSRRILRGLLILTLLATFTVLGGCGDDDDTFEGADVSELQNTSWTFGDLRVFSLPNIRGTLAFATFGAGDVASFTLTLDGGQTASGTATGNIDLNENDVVDDFSTCEFVIATSTITPATPGLTDGDTNNTDCFVGDDGLTLQLTNQSTDEVSTGTRQ